MKLISILVAFLALAPNLSADDEVRISVLSLLRPERVSIECDAELDVAVAGSVSVDTRLLKGERLFVQAAGESLILSFAAADGKTVELDPCDRCEIGGSGIEKPLRIDSLSPNKITRRLSGRLSIQSRKGVLVLILSAPLEQAVGEVVAAECGAGCPKEAAAAMAVAVRSYIVATGVRNGDTDFDLVDSTQSLLYRGRDGAFGPDAEESLSLGAEAASVTVGVVMACGGSVVPAYFHACCGGETATPPMIWGATEFGDCYQPVACPYCSKSDKFAWRREAPLAGVLEALGLQTGDAESRFSVVMHEGGGYAREVTVDAGGETRSFSAENFRLLIGRSLGWNTVRSNRFSIELDGDTVRFEGTGFGHGVGLCQEGAHEAARQGLSWNRILRRYYPRCEITALDEWKR